MTKLFLIACLSASAPTADCAGITFRAGQLSGKVRAAHVSRTLPVQGFLDAADTQVPAASAVIGAPMCVDTPKSFLAAVSRIHPETPPQTPPRPPRPPVPLDLSWMYDDAWFPHRRKLRRKHERLAGIFRGVRRNPGTQQNTTRYNGRATALAAAKAGRLPKPTEDGVWQKVTPTDRVAPWRQKTSMRRIRAWRLLLSKRVAVQRSVVTLVLRSLRLLYNLTVMPLAYAVDLLLSIVWCIGHPLYSARLVVYAALNIIHWVGLTFSFLCLLFYWARYTAPQTLWGFLSAGTTSVVTAAAPSLLATQVFVKPKQGKTVTVDNVLLSGSVGDFKEQLAAKIGIPARHTRLVFGGKQLDDRRPLSKYGILKASTIQGMFSLCGGMQSAGSSDDGGSSGASPDHMSLDELEELRQQELEEESNRQNQRQRVSDEAELANQEGSEQGRAKLRADEGASLRLRAFAKCAPNVSGIVGVLKRLDRLVALGEKVRVKGTGLLSKAKYKRASPIRALARDPHTGEGDVTVGAKTILPFVQSFWDYRQAIVGNQAEVDEGREAAGGDCAEAPAHPRSDGGFNGLRAAIFSAYNNREAFWRWCEERWPSVYVRAMGESAYEADGTTVAKRIAHAKMLLPSGDVVLPPLCISGQARESKSYLILALIGIVLQIPDTKVALSVAPYKLAALDEVLGKIDTMGWKESGYAQIESTRQHSTKEGEEVSEEAIDRFAKADIFLYSHDTIGDVQIFARVLKKWRADGKAVLSVHDEADTLVKALCKISDEDDVTENADKDTILHHLRDSYSPYWARTVLVGATQLATLQEKSIWGSQLLASPHDDLKRLQPKPGDKRPSATWLLKPLKPARGGGTHYIGLKQFVETLYDEETSFGERNALTPDNIKRALYDNRAERKVIETAYWEKRIVNHEKAGVVRGQSTSQLPRATKANPTPDARPPVRDAAGAHVTTKKDPKKPLYYTETPEQARVRYGSTLSRFKGNLLTAKTRRHDETFEFSDAGANPELPLGFCTPWKDEQGFAMITQRIKAHLNDPHPVKEGRAMPGEVEDHHYNKMLVLSPTTVASPQEKDPAGGLSGYGRHVVNLAKKLKKPTAVMVYTSKSGSIVAGAMGNGIAVKAKVPGAPKSEGDSVKLVVMLPVKSPTKASNNSPLASASTGTTIEWKATELEVHGSAREALTSVHQLMADYDCAHEIRNLRVVAIGYGLFSAALTLSVSDLELPPEGGVSQMPEVQRLHYIPKSMVFCKAKEDNNQAVQYQMLGRCMNTLIGFVPNEPDGYHIDVLTHRGTLDQAKTYYKVEQYMIRVWSGESDTSDPNTGKNISGRVPFNLLSALNTFAAQQGAGDLKVGYRNEEIGTTFRGGRCGPGSKIVADDDLTDYFPNAAAVNSLAPEEEAEEEEEVVQKERSLFHDIMHLLHCDGLEPDWWDQYLDGPSHKVPEEDAVWDKSVVKGLVDRLQDKEKEAISHGNKVNGHYVLTFLSNTKSFYRKYPDLVSRLVPAYFKLLCKLVDFRDNQDQSSGKNVRVTKGTAFKLCNETLNAIRYLIFTEQFNPKGEDMWEQLRALAIALGRDAGKRDRALRHMFRALRWIDTSGPTKEHENYVTAMNMLLTRILLVSDKATPAQLKKGPWMLPACGTSLPKPSVEVDPALEGIDAMLKRNPAAEGEDEHEAYVPYHLTEDEDVDTSPRTPSQPSQPSSEKKGCLPNITGQFKAQVLQELQAMFPDQMTEALHEQFKKALVDGDLTGHAMSEQAAGAASSRVLKGVYVLLLVAKSDDAFTIPSGESAVKAMREVMPKMHEEDGKDAFTKACARYPTRENPYAHRVRTKGNHNVVQDWCRGFELWVQWREAIDGYGSMATD